MKKLIAFVEIPASDFDRAVKFYSEVFNLEMKSMDCGAEKMAFLPGTIENFLGDLKVQVSNNKILDEIDTIVLCTGYRHSYPFLINENNKQNLISLEDND